MPSQRISGYGFCAGSSVAGDGWVDESGKWVRFAVFEVVRAKAALALGSFCRNAFSEVLGGAVGSFCSLRCVEQVGVNGVAAGGTDCV